MKFNISFNEIMGSKSKIKILRHLFRHNASMSENELAKIVSVSPMTINRLMKELLHLNLVSKQRIGNASVWTLNKESYSYAALSKIMADIDLVPVPFEHLKATITKNIPKRFVKKVILFGSVATGKANPNSDIDLFILVKSNYEAEKLSPYIDRLSNSCIGLYGNRLSPYMLTEAELKKKKKLPLLHEIRRGIQLI